MRNCNTLKNDFQPQRKYTYVYELVNDAVCDMCLDYFISYNCLLKLVINVCSQAYPKPATRGECLGTYGQSGMVFLDHPF